MSYLTLFVRVWANPGAIILDLLCGMRAMRAR